MSKRAKIQLREPPAEEPEPAKPTAGRRGKKQIAGWFPPATSAKLKSLAAATDKSVQDLLQEGLDDLFTKYASKIPKR